MQKLRVFGEPQHLASLGKRASERLFATHADQWGAAGRRLAMDFAHDVEPSVVRRQDPHGVDFA